MQELERMISIYHTANVVCLVLAIAFLAISVFLFFKFDIKKIFDLKTGRGAKKTIRRMEEVNARTGKLRQDAVAYTPGQLNQESQRAEPSNAAAEHTAPLNTQEATAALSERQESETTVLSEAQRREETEKREIPGGFRIVKSVLWIHTKELL